MNQIDATVTAVLSRPYRQFGRWWVHVRYESYGRESDTQLMFDSEQDAGKVKPGYKFLA